MDDICTYHIAVEGRMNGDTLYRSSPLEMKLVRTDDMATLFTICTDQSGVIGLIRYLHGQGFVLLSVVRGR